MSSLNVTLDASQLNKFAEGMERFGRDLPGAVDRAVNLTANEGKRYIVERTPKITGNLRRGFQVQRLRQMVWRIYNLVEYLMWIEAGERKDPRSGKKIHRRAGPARMMAGSIKDISKRLDSNLSTAIRALLARRS